MRFEEMTTVVVKDEYWIRIGDSSYPAKRILSISITEPSEDAVETVGIFILIITVIGSGIFIGVKFDSWIVGVLASALIFIGFCYFWNKVHPNVEAKKLCNLSIELEQEKNGHRIVARRISKTEAERLRSEIELHLSRLDSTNIQETDISDRDK